MHWPLQAGTLQCVHPLLQAGTIVFVQLALKRPMLYCSNEKEVAAMRKKYAVALVYRAVFVFAVVQRMYKMPHEHVLVALTQWKATVVLGQRLGMPNSLQFVFGSPRV